MKADEKSNSDDKYEYDPHWRDLAAFHSNETESLLKQFQHVETLLGLSHHSYSEGAHCEALLRNYLRAILPQKYSVDTGFIRTVPEFRGPQPTIASPQIDILIHDAHEYAPLFRSDEFVIVCPEAVCAVIEVKKTLRSDALDDALNNIAAAKQCLRKALKTKSLMRVFTGVFAFKSELNRDSDTYVSCLERSMANYPYWECAPDIVVAALPGVSEPDHRKIGSSTVIYISCNAKDGYLSLRTFNPEVTVDGTALNFTTQMFALRLFERCDLKEIGPSMWSRFALPDPCEEAAKERGVPFAESQTRPAQLPIKFHCGLCLRFNYYEGLCSLRKCAIPFPHRSCCRNIGMPGRVDVIGPLYAIIETAAGKVRTFRYVPSPGANSVVWKEGTASEDRGKFRVVAKIHGDSTEKDYASIDDYLAATCPKGGDHCDSEEIVDWTAVLAARNSNSS